MSSFVVLFRKRVPEKPVVVFDVIDDYVIVRELLG